MLLVTCMLLLGYLYALVTRNLLVLNESFTTLIRTLT